MTEDQLRLRATGLLRDHLGIDETFTAATTFEELHADSLDLIEVGMALEDEFGVKTPDAAIDEWRTVGDLLDWLLAQHAQPRR